jgi:hypothetical protein
MKTMLLAIVGFSLVIVSCAGSKSEIPAQFEQLAKGPEIEERAVPLKRHDRW